MLPHANKTAERLGIKVTRADPRSQIYDCWADRVCQAHFLDADARYFASKNETLSSQFAAKRDAIIKDANRYAI